MCKLSEIKHGAVFMMEIPHNPDIKHMQAGVRPVLAIKFIYDRKEYRYSARVTCSCKNVYYYGTFSVDKVIKDVRAFKKIKEELISAIEVYESKYTTE